MPCNSRSDAYPFFKVSEGPESKIRLFSSWLFIIGASTLTAAAFGLLLMGARRDPDFYAVAVRHFPTVVGLPFAAMAALFIAISSKIVTGEKLNFKGFGFEFNGASGPIILWLICFLGISFTINETWNKTYSGPISKHLQDWLHTPWPEDSNRYPETQKKVNME